MGWRFASESTWTLRHARGSRKGHPRYTGARTREGRGWPTTSTTTTEKRPHDKDRSESNVLSATSGDTHLESYMVAELVRETGDLRGVEHVVNRIEVETPRILKEKINQETEHIKISQNQYTDKVVDLTVVIQRQLTQNQTMHRTKPDKRVWVGPPIQ